MFPFRAVFTTFTIPKTTDIPRQCYRIFWTDYTRIFAAHARVSSLYRAHTIAFAAVDDEVNFIPPGVEFRCKQLQVLARIRAVIDAGFTARGCGAASTGRYLHVCAQVVLR